MVVRLVWVVLGGYSVFETLPAPARVLPDGRGFEMLTPSNKGDGEDMFGVSKEDVFAENNDFGSSSLSGNEFLFWTKSGFGSFPASGMNFYRFSRGGEGGWAFQPGASPTLGIQSFRSVVFNPVGFLVSGWGILWVGKLNRIRNFWLVRRGGRIR